MFFTVLLCIFNNLVLQGQKNKYVGSSHQRSKQIISPLPSGTLRRCGAPGRCRCSP